MQTKFNVYDNIRTPQVKNFTTISEWFSLIQSSEYSSLIESARAFGKGHTIYDHVKAGIPAITYNFVFKARKSNDNIIQSSGLLYIDINDNNYDIDSLDKSKVYAYYKSFGGNGYCILVQVNGLTIDNYCASYISICNDLGLSNFYDSNAKKCTQFSILSFDPDIFINNNSFVYSSVNDFDTPSVVIKEKKKTYTVDGGSERPKATKAIRYNNLDEIDILGEYATNWNGWEYVNCWLPFRKVSSGKRNNTLLSYANNLVWLNPQLTIHEAENILHRVNIRICAEPITTAQVKGIVKSVFKYKQNGSLKPIYNAKDRKIVFAKGTLLSSKEKLAICRKLLIEKRSEESLNKLYEILENWDFLKYGKIIQREIYKHYPISKKTVQKYWSEFKDYVVSLNNQSLTNNLDIIKENELEIENLKVSA